MPEGLAPASLPTLANAAAPGPAAPPAPPAADPGEFAPSTTPAPAPKSFAQQRLAQDQAAADKQPAPATDQQQAPAAADGDKIKVGKYETTEGELGAMLERQSLEDLRKATVPSTPADYKLELPENLKLPGDQQFRFDEAGNKAAFDAARAWAHNKGMSQTDFAEMLGLYASQEAQQQAALAERSRQEIAKVGINGPQRVDAVGKWITGMVGEADARPIRATLVTDSHLRFYEKIMTQLTNQGGASFSQSHRAPPDNAKIPGYENMSFEQRRLAQDQNAARRR
jgi:hypothetical protein